MKPADQDKMRAWVDARVREYGTVDKAWPRDEFTAHAWRDLCRHLNVGAAARASSLEEALKRVAELAG